MKSYKIHVSVTSVTVKLALSLGSVCLSNALLFQNFGFFYYHSRSYRTLIPLPALVSEENCRGGYVVHTMYIHGFHRCRPGPLYTHALLVVFESYIKE